MTDLLDTNVALFFGRFHPFIVHLPIGILVLAFLMELWQWVRKDDKMRSAISFALICGFAAAVISIILGMALSAEGGYNPDTLERHKWGGISVAVLSGLTWVIRNKNRKAYLSLLAVLMATLTVTGHLGGTLTHGSGFLTENAPSIVKKIMGQEVEIRKPLTNLDDALVFQDLIQPILKDNCVTCHNANKFKGELRLDTREGILVGGESKKTLIPGRSSESEIFRRTTLLKDHDDFMPPDGRKPLTKAETDFIEWWIQEGAPFDKQISELPTPPEIKSQLERIIKENRQLEFLGRNVPKGDEQAIAFLKARKALVLPLFENTNFLMVKTINAADPLDGEFFRNLLLLRNQVVWLDLAGKDSVDDKVISQLVGFSNLKKLYLNQTSVTDSAVKSIIQLETLEYVNAVDTEITDEGGDKLLASHIRKVYF